MRFRIVLLEWVCLVLLLGPCLFAAPATFVWIDELDISKAEAGWGTSQRNRSVEGNPLSIAGQKFERGFGTHAPGAFWIQLDGWTTHFYAFVGVDDEVGRSPASVEFIVFGKGKILWRSGIMKAGDPPRKVEVLVRGVKQLGLIASEGSDGNHFDHADWAEARLRVTGQPPQAIAKSSAEPYILTPPPPQTPRINGARIFGVRPGSPFWFTIPATGRRPITFSAKNLPDGLSLDKQTGQITGKLVTPGSHIVTLMAENSLGRDEKPLRIEVGEAICLTPPLGWNSWNCWAGAVDAEKIKTAARAMVDSGLANHG
ncbi:MAG: NPCBM/NEW2 domain-containing protein, partial [Sedimentisphaerales bacterium]|nr:NPCBM/NEW2 domain-containing protein [Sedimentisphaerales bacterium]